MNEKILMIFMFAATACVLAAFIFSISILWLLAVPFAIGTAIIFRSQNNNLFAIIWLMLATLYIFDFLFTT